MKALSWKKKQPKYRIFNITFFNITDRILDNDGLDGGDSLELFMDKVKFWNFRDFLQFFIYF